ncbi:DUF3696 domain-containing protein [bacterium]|nr:MAG: DUF3696 domain-containing protein [bacterium]
MLTRWSVQNFKSLSRTELALSAINVFAGANSSGKSSLIQSILLIKQTLQYAPQQRAIALNGPIVKLGGFDDVKNTFAPDQFISMGWSIDGPALGRAPRALGHWGRPSIRAVDCECFWDVPPPKKNSRGISPSDEVAKLQPKLLKTMLTVHRREIDRKPAQLNIERNQPSEEKLTVESPETAETAAFGPRLNSDYTIEAIDDVSRRELLQARADASFVGVLFSHFQPSQIAVRFDAGKDRAHRIAEAIFADPSPFDDDQDWEDELVSDDVLTTVKNWLRPTYSLEEVTQYFGDIYPNEDGECIVQEIVQASRYFKSQVSATSSDDRYITLDYPEVRSKIVEIIYNGPSWSYDLEIPRLISVTNDLSRSFFVNLVRYLGPLRDEPRHVYPLEALANPTDVGYRGEHTAAVLELNGDTSIEHVRPLNFDKPSARWSDKSRTSLVNAVVEWLQYVGVARQVKTEEKGVFGHQLQVKTNNDNNYHDLTNVGVGVSQVLPIIVSALLAPAGSLLIFEQPELHLHPRVQARLADFFIAMKFLGKQCVLETHSEYLVDRLRLRIAQSESEDLLKSVNIYFTKMTDGVTECKPVEITEYGAILDWPDDFFDQSQAEIEAIVRAARIKRAKNADVERGPKA